MHWSSTKVERCQVNFNTQLVPVGHLGTDRLGVSGTRVRNHPLNSFLEHPHSNRGFSLTRYFEGGRE